MDSPKPWRMHWWVCVLVCVQGCVCDASCCPSSCCPSSSSAGALAPPPPPGPPPPPVLDMAPPSDGGTDDARAALFADLRKGDDVAKGMIHIARSSHTDAFLLTYSRTFSCVQRLTVPFLCMLCGAVDCVWQCDTDNRRWYKRCINIVSYMSFSG